MNVIGEPLSLRSPAVNPEKSQKSVPIKNRSIWNCFHCRL